MLHRRQLKRDIQRTARGRRTASAGSRGRKGKGTGSAWIVEPGKAILSTSHPIGPESILKTDGARPAKRGGRLVDDCGTKCPRKVVAGDTVRYICGRSSRTGRYNLNVGPSQTTAHIEQSRGGKESADAQHYAAVPSRCDPKLVLGRSSERKAGRAKKK